MHIAFVSSKHPPLDKRVFDKEAVTLGRAGFKVTHLAPGEGETFTKDGVDVVLYRPPKTLMDRVFQLPRLYKMAAELDADWHHCNEVDSWLVGVMLKIFKGKGCAFDVHEHYPSTFAESRFPRWLRPFAANAVRFTYQLLTPFTDNLVLAKKTVAGDFWFSSGKHVLVRNFAPAAARSKKVFAATKTRSEQAGPLQMVHLGLISRLRGWPQILEAMVLAKNQDLQLLVIGDFNDGSLDDFRSRADELRLTDRIEVRDWMPFDQAFDALLTSDVGLITFQPGTQNHVFAMPHKMFDYMLAGLAVILPDFAVEVAPVIAEKSCGILLDPSSVQAMADSFDYLSDNRDKCREMGQRGIRAVIEEYNWENEAARLIAMYRGKETNL